jgi:hypothetical protein
MFVAAGTMVDTAQRLRPVLAGVNTAASLARIERYLNEVEPYDEIRVLLFSHGGESVGLGPNDAWERLRPGSKDRGIHRRGP